MKKIILAALFGILVSCETQAQGTTPRLPYESHTLANGANFDTRITYLTDAATATDTSFIYGANATVFNNVIVLNAGDTLNGSKVIHLATVTRSGVAYTKAKLCRYDRLTLYYTESVIAKTIKLTGAFGVGGATYTITTGTTNGKLSKAEYVFDGANFIVQ